MFRGASHRVLEQGVSGLYFFNLFIPSEYGTITDVADRARLKTLTKTYAIDTSSAWGQNGTVYTGPLPLNFPPAAEDTSIELRLEIPEDLRGAKSVRLAVQWRGKNAAGRSHWSVHGNEAKLLNPTENAVLEYDGSAVKPGLNRLRVTVTSGFPVPLVLDTVRVIVTRV